MRNEHSARQPDRQRATPQEGQVGLANLLGGRPEHLLQPQAEHQIEHLLVLLDGVVGQLGQFMITQDEVRLQGELGLELGHVLEHVVRHAAAVLRVGGAAVADLLQDEVPAGMALQVGNLPDGVEVAPVAVQIASHHHLVGRLGCDLDGMPDAAGRVQVRLGCRGERGDRLLDVLN